MMRRSLLVVLGVLMAASAIAGTFFIFRGSGDGTVDSGVVQVVPEAAVVTDIETAAPVSAGATAPADAPPDTLPVDKHKAPAPKTQSSLIDLALMLESSGREAAQGLAAERGLEMDDGKVQLVIETSDPAAAMAEVTAAGGVVETTNGGLVQAAVPVDRIEALSASAAIAYVREPQRPALSALSEGVADIGADTWQGAGHDGTGVKVAIIDLGFQGYQGLMNAGELPASVTTASFRGDGDITGGGESHGSACAEIVYDIAPGAQFYLVNFSTDVELANAIDYVIAQDIDVVSASWSFFGNFRGDGQGPINDMVKNAHDSGIFWANVAGNAAQDHWSGPFTDTDADTWNEFAAGDEGNDLNVAAGTRINIYLTWNRWPVTDQDYDMYLYHESNLNNAVAAGEGYQGGTQAPAEQIHYTVPPGKSGRYIIKINNYSATGDATFKLYTYPLHLEHQTAAGSLAGQPTDSPYVMTTGAVPVGGTALETFSSRGPTVDGRIKPDIVAPNRVSTSSYGNTGFWGTSAAAPHVAGAGALVMQVYPGYLPAQVSTYLRSRATDLGSPGMDPLYGSGKLDLGSVPDSDPPVVASVTPAGDVDAVDTTVSVDYSDSDSGIDTSAVTVTLDGSILAGCTVTAGNASCPVTGLAGGEHTIGGSVADLAGNSASISGAFTVTCFQPVLGLGSAQPFWATYQDYVNRELSVTYSLCNNGSNDAGNVTVVGSSSTNGVIAFSPLPAVIGDLARTGPPPTCVAVTYKYLVPFGVESFKTTTYVTADSPCGVTYDLPGPYGG